MGAVEFFVPGVPVGKGRHRSTAKVIRKRHGRVVKAVAAIRHYTPDETANYEKAVQLHGAVALKAAGLGRFEGAVLLRLEISVPVPASWPRSRQQMALGGQLLPTIKPDGDNVIKAVCDGLNGVAWDDDVQVTDYQVSRRYAAVPGVRVHVSAVGPGFRYGRIVGGE